MTASAPANVKPRAGEHTIALSDEANQRLLEFFTPQIRRRIVACVNFLEGIETERLTPELHSIYENLGNLLAERDQLRARERELEQLLGAALIRLKELGDTSFKMPKGAQ